MSNAIIKSRHGSWSVLFNVFGLTGGLGCLFLATNRLVVGVWLSPSTLLLTAAGVLLTLTVVTALSLRLVITLDGLMVKSVWGSRKVAWREVTEVRLQTNFFGKYTAILYFHPPGRGIGLLLGLLGNDHELAKALLEAASTSNPHVSLTGSHHYGPPPYGVFSREV